MGQFKGTYLVRRDGKGRVSIPSAFRDVLRGDHPVNGPLVLRPSYKHACIEGWHPASFEQQGAHIQLLPRFGDDEEDLALALFSDATDAEPDKEGRIVLPRALAEHAALADEVAFVGAGSHFQVWHPPALERRIAAARARARLLQTPSALAAGGAK